MRKMIPSSCGRQRRIRLFLWVSRSWILIVPTNVSYECTHLKRLRHKTGSNICHTLPWSLLLPSPLTWYTLIVLYRGSEESWLFYSLCRNGWVLCHCRVQTDENEKQRRHKIVSASDSHACGCSGLCGRRHDSRYVVYQIALIVDWLRIVCLLFT